MVDPDEPGEAFVLDPPGLAVVRQQRLVKSIKELGHLTGTDTPLLLTGVVMGQLPQQVQVDQVDRPSDVEPVQPVATTSESTGVR